MQKLKVKGKNILSGEIKISGSKNATLPILAASILSEKKIDLKSSAGQRCSDHVSLIKIYGIKYQN